MVEIRYGEQYKVADLAGQTISEARERFRTEFDIPDKARANLNGRIVRHSAELDTILCVDDRLSFAIVKSRTPFLFGALLLALAFTGGSFAYGFTSTAASLNANIADSNLADVVINPDFSNIYWSGYGLFKGSIGGPHSVFNVIPTTGYTGDLVVSVTLANADQLNNVYRVLALELEMVNSSDNTTEDINSDGIVNPFEDWVMLTLDNGSVSMFLNGGENVTIRVKSGYYITQVKPYGGWTGSATPDLFCEVTAGSSYQKVPVVRMVASFSPQYTLNFNTPFTRSPTPMSMTAGNSNASQSLNQDGSVALTINNASGYADCGFYFYSGSIGNLNTVEIQASNNSGPFSVNIWFDRDNNGEFFVWNNNVYQGVGNDAYILGPASQNGTLTVNSGSMFYSLNPGSGDYTLGQLKSGAAPGINSNTKIKLWVGFSVNSGSQSTTIQSISIS